MPPPQRAPPRHRASTAVARAARSGRERVANHSSHAHNQRQPLPRSHRRKEKGGPTSFHRAKFLLSLFSCCLLRQECSVTANHVDSRNRLTLHTYTSKKTVSPSPCNLMSNRYWSGATDVARSVERRPA